MKSTLLLSLLLTSIAPARIGETPEQCEARYGEIVNKTGGGEFSRITFAKGGVEPVCYFVAGKCESIQFQSILPSRIGASQSKLYVFTHEQVMKLLEASSGGAKWRKTSETGYLITFETEDGKLRASNTGELVTIQTVADIERRKALLTPEAIGKALEGF